MLRPTLLVLLLTALTLGTATDAHAKKPKPQRPPAPKTAPANANIEDFVKRHVQHVEAEDVGAYLDDFLLSDEQRATLRAQAERLFAEYDFDITLRKLEYREKSPRHAKLEITQHTRLTSSAGDTSETLILLTLSLRNLDGHWIIAATDRKRLEP